MPTDETVQKLEVAAANIADAIADLRPADRVPSDWMEIARAELGTKQVAGARSNPRILEYLRSTTLGRWAASRDETAWCSAFANWTMSRAGIEGTGSAMARSWMGWGVELEVPMAGCIVVLSRGRPPKGHVGFFVKRTTTGKVQLLGGNQGDKVSLASYPASRVLGYRWPADLGSRGRAANI